MMPLSLSRELADRSIRNDQQKMVQAKVNNDLVR